MRSTRRRLEASSLTAGLGFAAALALVSCVVERRLGVAEDDVPVDAGASDGAQLIEASSPSSDAAVDASSPPPAPKVECAGTAPCALVVRAPLAAYHFSDYFVTGELDVMPTGRLPPLAEAFCVLLASGKVACWGDNGDSQLGRAADVDGAIGAPAIVEGVDAAVDLDRGCAVLSDGRAVCWGYFASPGSSPGETGASFPAPQVLSLPPLKKIRMTRENGCAILANDAVSCWGVYGASGQLAYIDAPPSPEGLYGPAIVPLAPEERTADLAVAGASILSTDPFWFLQPPELSGGATFVLDDKGVLSSWGSNVSLGRVSSLSPDPHPTPIGLTSVSAVCAAGNEACAIAQNDVYCWGNGTENPKALGVVDPVQVATAGPAPFGRGCAVDRKGGVWCWGTNDFGQAGDGTTELAPVPVKVAGLPRAAAAVEVTERTSCAVLVDGRVFCWGDDSAGQLGRSLPTERSLVPIEVHIPEESP